MDHCSCATEVLDSPRTVTLKLVNETIEPFFHPPVSITVQTRYKKLHKVMEEAAKQDTNFRFSVRYFGADLGYMVLEYRGTWARYEQEECSWAIKNGAGQMICQGICSYIPKDGETVTFEVTRTTTTCP